MIGAQASNDQLEKILAYIDVGKKEGAQLLTGGERAHLGGELEAGFYVRPTVFFGHNKMRIFQEEIFGPVVAVTKFHDMEEALHIANDTLYGLGSGVWTFASDSTVFNASSLTSPPLMSPFSSLASCLAGLSGWDACSTCLRRETRTIGSKAR